MKLTDIDLKGLGRFEESPGAFTVTRYHLPRPWEYQHYNGLSLVRLRHDGGIFFQVAPPGGPLLLNHDRLTPTPSLMTWIIPEGAQPFSNVWQPQMCAPTPGAEPQSFECAYAPDATRYTLQHDGWIVRTEVALAPDEITLIVVTTLTNARENARNVTLMPVIRPHMAPAVLAPWDMPHWYQTIAFTKIGSAAGFWVEMRDPGGNPAKRFRSAMVTDLEPTTFEVSSEAFLGAGRWDSPQALWDGKLQRPTDGGIPPFGKVTNVNAAVGMPPVAAVSRSLEIPGGASFQFTIALAKLPETADGRLPGKSHLVRLTRYFEPQRREKMAKALQRELKHLTSIREIRTPDEALNRYVNEHLAFQLHQVQDRGWTNMRGVRDTAQDATAFVPIEPQLAKNRLIEILSLQRSDGWFLRQYSTLGRRGKHDDRPYVDSGLWVWELIWEYLVWTRDFAVLKHKCGWLDKDRTDTLLDHALRLFGYFLDRKNVGQHGLCKIREGDWNDSVNAAGLEGRGESVMVSCQLVLALEQAAEMLEMLQRRPLAKRYRAAAQAMRGNLLRHAYNRAGYFSGVFTDAGQWVFSPKDPDGARRINATPNAFAIIAGVARGAQRDSVLNAVAALKGPYGWRLFDPPIGHPPIRKLGRIGQGDLAPGIGENGAPYNHGSHGFLGRAAWTAGRGELLYESLRYMLPYDQNAHPILQTKSPPYLVVNAYGECLGQEGLGGYPFQTGSIPVAARNCFDGLLGFRPGLRHVVIDPVIPSGWQQVSGHVPFLGATCRLVIENPHGVECGVARILVNGKEIGEQWHDERLGRDVIGLPIPALTSGKTCTIQVTLGKR